MIVHFSSGDIVNIIVTGTKMENGNIYQTKNNIFSTTEKLRIKNSSKI